MSEIEEKLLEQLPVEEIYSDLAKTTIKETGNIVGLLPRLIHTSLLPIEEKILKKEYELKRIKKLLELKLSQYDDIKIISPQPYKAIPLLEGLIYYSSCEQVQEMYINLLSKSMIADEEHLVHPAFAEIIKQLTPDEVRIINYLHLYGNKQPVIEIKRVNNIKKKNDVCSVSKFNDFQQKSVIVRIINNNKIDFLNSKLITFNDDKGDTFSRNTTILGYKANCEFPEKIESYLDNLNRLKIINIVYTSYLNVDDSYAEIFKSEHVKNILINDYKENSLDWITAYHLKKGFICFSEFGKEFVDICTQKA